MTAISFAEWRPDVAGLNTEFASDVMNVYCSAAGYIPLKKLAPLTDALGAAPTGGFKAVDDSGTIYVFAGTSDKLYLLDNSDLSWSDVSKSATTYSSTTTERWQFEQFGQYVIAVNANDNPQVYQLGTSTTFDDLAGSPPKARHVKACGDFLFLSGLTDNSNRVQWSALNDITGWTPGTNSSDFQDFGYGEAVMGVTGTTNPFIIHKHAITAGTFVPGSDVVFTFQQINYQTGASSSYSICSRGDLTFFVDAGSFCMMDGAGQVTFIGKEKIDRTFFAAVDSSTLSSVIAVIDPAFPRVWFIARYSSSTAFDRALIYDWTLDRWTQAQVNVLFLLQAATIGYTLDNLGTLTGYNLDTLPFSLDAPIWKGGFPFMGAVDTDYKLGFFAGSNAEATLVTPEVGDTTGRLTYVDGVSAIIDTNEAKLSVGTRMQRGDSVSYGMEYGATSASDRIDFRSCARYHTFKTRIPAGTSWSLAQGLDVSSRMAGRR